MVKLTEIFGGFTLRPGKCQDNTSEYTKTIFFDVFSNSLNKKSTYHLTLNNLGSLKPPLIIPIKIVEGV